MARGGIIIIIIQKRNRSWNVLSWSLGKIGWQQFLPVFKKRGSDVANMFFFGWFLVIWNWKAWREENQIFTVLRENMETTRTVSETFLVLFLVHVKRCNALFCKLASLRCNLREFSRISPCSVLQQITRSLKTLLKMKNVFCLISSNVQCQEKDSKNFQYADVPLSPCWRSGEPRTGSWVCVHNSSPTQSGPKVSHPAIAMPNI